MHDGLEVVFDARVGEAKTASTLSSKDVMGGGSVRKGADRADGLDELRAVGLERLGGGVTGSQGIREARLHKGSYGVKFLPGSQERLFDFASFVVSSSTRVWMLVMLWTRPMGTPRYL